MYVASPLPPSPHRTSPARPGRRTRVARARRWWVPAVVAVLALVATGCDTHIEGDDGAKPVVLQVSDTWVSQHQDTNAGGGAAGGSAVPSRIGALEQAITELRQATGTGWVGRQDDVTGYLTELSGGAWTGTPAAFMDAYGTRLFGVDSATLRLGEADPDTIPGVVTTKATQAVGDVPVLDASLVFSARGERLTGLRGRVFPDLRVDAEPVVTPEQAAAAAAAQSGGTSTGTPRLVVLPTGSGTLAWEVVVVTGDQPTDPTGQPGSQPGSQVAPATGYYYIDAATGDLVDVRPASTDLAAPVPGAATFRAGLALGRTRLLSVKPATNRAGTTATATSAAKGSPDASSVELTGTDPLGRPLTGYGLQTDRGVQLTDTTTKAYDSSTGTGAVKTYDASAVKNESQLPGPQAVSRTSKLKDSEELAAQAYSHDVVAYWESLGRDSWDGQGGDLVSSVHFGPPDYCNAFFAGYLPQPQMVYGGPCTIDGEAVSNSLVEPDVAAHEVTHGVTGTTARLLYTGQSGALNESFSDYFGNVIGDLVHGKDSSAIAEDACGGFTSPTLFCNANPDGTLSLRYMLNGNTLDDYLRVLDPGQRLATLLNYNQDYGGVHTNSAIWNNALWSIRTRLAQIDGQPGTTSPLAKAFDRAVYGALATRITPTSDFVDARNAVEQVIVDSQLDPVVLRVARETFDSDKICTGCPTTGVLAGDSVSSAPQTQLHPKVSGSKVAWLDISGSGELSGYAASTTLGGSGGVPNLAADGDAIDVAFAGDSLLVLDFRGTVELIGPDGSTTQVDDVNATNTLAAGLGGSDSGAAWLSGGDTIGYVDSAGKVSSADVTGLSGDTVIAVAAGGGTVAVGTDQGKVLTWTPASGGGFAQVGQASGAVIDIATYAGNVFTITDGQASTLISADGQTTDVTGNAVPFGATMSNEYVVWSEATGPEDAGVAPGGSSGYPETDLYLMSLASGKIYDLLPAPAQQGFPSISGRQLVWQDATLGGDDVFTATVPGGL